LQHKKEYGTMNVNNNFIAMKNIIQISLATMTGVAIGAISTFSLFATDIISFPAAPLWETPGGAFSGNFAQLFTSCAGSGLAIGYSGTTKNLECMSMSSLKDILLSWSLTSTYGKTCTNSWEFLTWFDNAGVPNCKPIE
jgi:hypothetical protein